MEKFIIIGGPQATGKSSFITTLKEEYQKTPDPFGKESSPIFPLQESRQVIAHQYMLQGAIFMKRKHEIEVINCDFNRMDTILKRYNNQITYVDECNVFTLAHASAHGIVGMEKYLNSYIKRLKKLRTRILFIDTPVEISWERRKSSYEQRLIYFLKKDREGIMQRYHDYLEKTYLLLMKMYEDIPFPKVMIDGNQEKSEVYKRALNAFLKLS